MNIIDFHVHVYPDEIAEKAVTSVSNFYGIKINHKGTVNALLEDISDTDIKKSVVHSVAILPKHVKNINNFIAEQCNKCKDLVGYGTIHPDMEDPLTEIERIVSLGLKGIKIHPDTQLFNMDDRKMMEIYGMLEGRLPILIHCGDYRYHYSHPGRLVHILDNFPKLTVIAAHFGGWSIFDLALEYLKDRECYLDTSSSLMFLGSKRAQELIHLYGAERILFGSDFPMWSPKEELIRFLQLNLTNYERQLILYDNAERLLR